jgi:hypothetical protein
MDNTFICNGVTQLIVIPENEADRSLMVRLISQGEIEVIHSQHAVGLLDKSIKDCLIIRPKKKLLDAEQT